MPEELAKLVHLVPVGSAYRLVGDMLYEQYREVDFVDMYHAEGKPGISPVDLAFVTVFQFLENLSDRQAAEALRVRVDWKYALHLPLDYAGFNFSVLSEFRDRVIRHEAEARLFDAVLTQLRALGLVKRRGRQRTDSLAVLSKMRDLNRLEMVVETLRLALRAMLKAEVTWTRATVPTTWEEVYGDRCITAKMTQAERQGMAERVGPDGQWLLERLQAETAPPGLRTLSAVELLATVWQQQFEMVEGRVVFRDKDDADGQTRISTPHDPDARYSKKGKQRWVGDKLQVTETDDEERPHLITDIAITSSVETDYEALDGIQGRLEDRDLLPAQQYADSGYVTETNLVHSAGRNIDLVGPVQRDTSRQARMPEGIALDQFAVDPEACTATCPAGQHAGLGTRRAKRLVFRFPKVVCAACALRPRCCTGEGGRTISLGRHHHILQAARARQETEVFKTDYHQHRSGVEGCLSAMVRGQGLRTARYTERSKRHLHALFTAAGVNLRRAARWLAGRRPQVRRQGLRLASAT
jgi:transposase